MFSEWRRVTAKRYVFEHLDRIGARGTEKKKTKKSRSGTNAETHSPYSSIVPIFRSLLRLRFFRTVGLFVLSLAKSVLVYFPAFLQSEIIYVDVYSASIIVDYTVIIII